MRLRPISMSELRMTHSIAVHRQLVRWMAGVRGYVRHDGRQAHSSKAGLAILGVSACAKHRK